jgi:hypothetical protein
MFSLIGAEPTASMRIAEQCARYVVVRCLATGHFLAEFLRGWHDRPRCGRTPGRL